MKYLYAMLAFALALFTAACSDPTPPRTVYIEKPVPVYVQPSAGNTEYVQQGPVAAPPVYQQPAYAYQQQPAPAPVSQPAASTDNGIGAGTALVVGALAGAATSAAVSHAMNTKAQQSARYVPTPTPAPYVAKPASTYKPLQLASAASVAVVNPVIVVRRV